MEGVDREALRAQRLARARRLMAEEGLDGLLVTGVDNVRYLTDIDQPYFSREFFYEKYAAVLSRDGAPVLLSSPYGYPYYVATHTWLRDIRVLRDYVDTLNYRAWAEDIAAALRDAGLSGARVGVDVINFHAAAYLQEHLDAHLPGTRLVSAYDALLRMRAVKQPEELKLMRRALEILERGLAAAVDALRPGVKECEVAAACMAAMLAAGAEGWSHVAGIRGGENSRLFAIWPSERRFREGDLVNMDPGCTYKGYNADIHRTTILGEPSAEQRRVYRALKEALEDTIRAARPGMTAGQLVAHFQRCMEDAGLGDYTMPFGHGIGLRLLEMPYLGLHGHEETVLEPGMVICFEPRVGLRRRPEPGEGLTPVLGGEIVLEDEILITEQGAERLSTFPYDERLLS